MVLVGSGVGVWEGRAVLVGLRVSVGTLVGFNAMAVSVPASFADAAVNAMTVGTYSGG